MHKGLLVACFDNLVFLSYVCRIEPHHHNVTHLNHPFIYQFNSRLTESNGHIPFLKKGAVVFNRGAFEILIHLNLKRDIGNVQKL